MRQTSATGCCGRGDISMKRIIVVGFVLLLGFAAANGLQDKSSDEGGRILALEKAWNLALESKDAKALDMLLASSMISVDIDGSIPNKSEFLASIKGPDYQPSQAITEQSEVKVYGDASVVIGIFRIKGVDKGKPYARRERFVDTWIKINGTWQCVATTSALITAKQSSD